MKTLAFYVCVLALVSFTSAAIARRRLISKEEFNICLSEINLQLDDLFRLFTVEDILKDRYKQPGNVEKQRLNGCLYHCLLRNAGVMEKSHFDIEEMHNKLTNRMGDEAESRIHGELNNCINEANNTIEKCQKSFNLVVCFIKAKFKKSENENSGNTNEEHEHEYEIEQ